MSSLHYFAFIVLIVWLVIWAAKNDKVSDNESTSGLFAIKKQPGENDKQKTSG